MNFRFKIANFFYSDLLFQMHDLTDNDALVFAVKVPAQRLIDTTIAKDFTRQRLMLVNLSCTREGAVFENFGYLSVNEQPQDWKFTLNNGQGGISWETDPADTKKSPQVPVLSVFSIPRVPTLL